MITLNTIEEAEEIFYKLEDEDQLFLNYLALIQLDLKKIEMD